MGSGIQVFNADGSLQFDSNNHLMLTLAAFDTGIGSGSLNFTLPGAGSIITAQIDPAGPTATPHTVSVSGNTVSWSGGNVSSKVRVFAV